MLGLSVQTQPLSSRELEMMTPKGVDPVEFAEDAARHPVKAKVLAVGMYAGGHENFEILQNNQEAILLRELWRRLSFCVSRRVRVVGAALTTFDLPFAMHRSWAIEVDVPNDVVMLVDGVFRFNSIFVDIQKAFSIGSDAVYDFTAIGTVLGTGGRDVDFVAGTFAAIWRRNRATAIKFLMQETRQPIEWARRMGID